MVHALALGASSRKGLEVRVLSPAPQMKIIITQQDSGQRIDKFLTQGTFSNMEITRGEIIRNIKSGNILVNGKEIKPSYVLKENDELELNVEEKNKKLVPDKNIKLEIIFENDDFVVANKPAGLKVHPVKSFQDHGTSPDLNLASGLLAKFPEIKNVGDEPEWRPGIVHRLDKDTSGLMVVARNQKTFEELKKKFQNREVEKKYAAIVCGHLENKEGKIEAPIARAMNYKKQKIAQGRVRGKIRPAITLYKVLKNLDSFDLVEVQPKTGRMHQIRVHLAFFGHPVAGDEKYSRKEFKDLPVAKRQMLHAKELKFNLNGRDYNFSAEPPSDFTAFLKQITLTKSR